MTGDHATTAALFKVLDREHHGLEALLALLNQEQEAIRTLSFDGVTAVTRAKFKLLEEIRTLEAQRATLVMQLAADWAVEAGNLTLRTIAERLNAQESAALRRRQGQLQETLLAVRHAGTFIGSLLTNSLALMNECLSAWRRVPTAVPLYSSSGSLQAAAAGGSLLAKKG